MVLNGAPHQHLPPPFGKFELPPGTTWHGEILNAIHAADSLGHVILQISKISCDFVELTKIPSPCFLNFYLVACTV